MKSKREQATELSKIKQIDITTAYGWLRNNTFEECMKKTRMTKSQAARRSRKARAPDGFRLPGSPIYRDRG